MDELLQQAVDLFGELCDVEAEERERRLSAIGARDSALRAKVEELLTGDRLATSPARAPT